ncbi:hypothetical protein PDESU_06071 [Pontiella desulfatans]|uniref:Uncharacterized protein n=1 Tax=Pontiella desulfatans TaxID=2750659 RepID=A0A6C2UBQ1_PONDE|nr:hypothetical protein [Pontiella desulfatans]VGO17475.1 hypothetical protein PDESU_06071 [Pontiella desulfatans]
MKKLGLILGLAAICIASVAEEKEGYFLPWDQKGSLIWRGAVEGNDGTWYDIRIVPGYTPPGRYGWKYMKMGGRNLREYVEAEKYQKIGEQSGEVLEWSYDDCLSDFTFKGAGKAWKKNYGRAAKRTEKRVFGWWLSYPWATVQSCVDNVFRIPTGLIGTTAGTGWSLVVIPAYHAVDSGTKAVWNGGVRGAVVPVSGWAWNTLASPPLSLVGQMPSHERVDGFWVREVEKGLEPGREPDQQAKVAVAEWGVLLHGEFMGFETRRNEINREQSRRLKEIEAEKRRVREEMARRKAAVTLEEEKRVESLLAEENRNDLVGRVQDGNWTKNSIRYYRDDIRNQLQKLGMSKTQQDAVIRILQEHPPASIDWRAYQKTDPLLETIDVIKKVGQ